MCKAEIFQYEKDQGDLSNEHYSNEYFSCKVFSSGLVSRCSE